MDNTIVTIMDKYLIIMNELQYRVGITDCRLYSRHFNQN